MRQIKFRGKRIDNGQWVYGDYVRRVIAGNTLHNITAPDMYDLIPVNPATVGQYIGLNDKNGNEIYEGGVVKFTDNKESPNYKIVWHNELCFFSAFYDNKYFKLNIHLIAVVGNVHDKKLEAE